MWTILQFIITYGYLQVLWIYYRYAMVTYDLQLPTGFVGKAQSLLMNTAGMGLLMVTENGWEIHWSLFEFPNHLPRE